MPKQKTFSDAQEQRILELHARRIPYPQISRELELPVTTIEGLIQRRGLAKKQRPIPVEILRSLYVDQGLSISKVAKVLALPKTNVEHWLRKNGIPRRPLRRYPRHPFNGALYEKAYLIGFRFGDLYAVRSGLGINVSTTSTHPAMLILFLTAFEKYGNVTFIPVYNRKYREYQWAARVALDSSFSFLLRKSTEVPKWITENRLCSAWFLAGFIDAEGSIGVVFFLMYGRWQVSRPFLSISNTNHRLMQEVATLMKLDSSMLRINHKKGTPTSRGGTIRKKDGWMLMMTKRSKLNSLLKEIPIHHIEKVAKCAIALKVLEGTDWRIVKTEYDALKNAIKEEVGELSKLAADRLREKNSGAHTIVGSA